MASSTNTPKSKREIKKPDTEQLKQTKKTGPIGFSTEDKASLLETIISEYENSEYTIESICNAYSISYESFNAWINGLSKPNIGENPLNAEHFKSLWSKAKKTRLSVEREKMVEAGQQYLHQFIKKPILIKKKTLIIKKGKTNETGEFHANEKDEVYQHTTIEEYEQPNSVLAILSRIDPEGYGGKAETDDGEVIVKFQTSPAPVRKEE